MEVCKESKKVFCFLNIFLPLLIGMGIYVLLRPDTYIAQSCYALCPMLMMCNLQFEDGNIFVRYFACDMLWAYALCMALVILMPVRKYYLAGGFSLSLGILVEVLQEHRIMNGTGDVWDVIFEGMAIAIAILVIKFYERKGNANEKENN